MLSRPPFDGSVSAVVRDEQRQFMPHVRNLQLLAHAPAGACVFVVELLGGRIDLNVGGQGAEYLVDHSKRRVRRG